MHPFDESAAQFPAPRSEEPANLRRNIVEELADHLTCAQRREQMAGESQAEEAVRRRVLDRFGDPSAVACKLWFDWMWEKIMTQRILVGLCVLMAVVSCVALGLAWHSLSRQQDLIATWQSTSQSQMQEQQKLFERLLEQSQKAASADASSKSPSDWNPVEFHFVSGKEDGPPAVGIKVSVSIATETGIPTMEGVSNEDGVVRFERVRYGSYTAWVKNGANESLLIGFTLQPGESLKRTVVCPDPPTEPVKISARIAWPEDLVEKGLWFSFQWDDVYRPVAGAKWRPPAKQSASRNYGGPAPAVVIAPNGEILESGSIPRAPSTLTIGRHQLVGVFVRRARGPKGEEPAFEKKSLGIDWPGSQYVMDNGWVLISLTGATSGDEVEQSITARSRRSSAGFFSVVQVSTADWVHRLEPGAADQTPTLWLTPTAEVTEKIRAELPRIEEARVSAAEAESRRATIEEFRSKSNTRRGPGARETPPTASPNEKKTNSDAEPAKPDDADKKSNEK